MEADSEKQLSLTTLVSAVKHQVSCHVSGDEMILDLNSGVYFRLNPVGTRIWTMLREPVRVEHIVEKVLDGYDVEANQCLNEISTFLKEMMESGLVEIHK